MDTSSVIRGFPYGTRPVQHDSSFITFITFSKLRNMSPVQAQVIDGPARGATVSGGPPARPDISPDHHHPLASAITLNFKAATAQVTQGRILQRFK